MGFASTSGPDSETGSKAPVTLGHFRDRQLLSSRFIVCGCAAGTWGLGMTALVVQGEVICHAERSEASPLSNAEGVGPARFCMGTRRFLAAAALKVESAAPRTIEMLRCALHDAWASWSMIRDGNAEIPRDAAALKVGSAAPRTIEILRCALDDATDYAIDTYILCGCAAGTWGLL
jgi:hypothetical protein